VVEIALERDRGIDGGLHDGLNATELGFAESRCLDALQRKGRGKPSLVEAMKRDCGDVADG
jgi:hypothetical protein